MRSTESEYQKKRADTIVFQQKRQDGTEKKIGNKSDFQLSLTGSQMNATSANIENRVITNNKSVKRSLLFASEVGFLGSR